MFHDFILGNYATLVGCVCLLVFMLTNHLLDRRNTRLFLAAVFSILLLTLADALELWSSTWTQPTQFRVVMSAIGYSLRPAIAFIIICILESRSGILKRVLSILLAADVLCSFSALFTPIMFSYSSDNQFVRGPIGSVPFIVSAIFLVGMLLLTVRKYQGGYFEESSIALFIVVISTVSIAGETIFHFKGLLNSSSAIAVVFYYLYFISQQLKRDQLTNLRNRHCFYLDAEKKKGRELVLLSIDINDLKVTNDTKGHAAGDKLICDVVNCIERNLPAEACAYRMGGDEFAILARFQKMEKIDRMVQAIRDDISAGGNSCAIGVAYYPINGNLEEVWKEADRAMYEDKRRIKQKKLENAGSSSPGET